MSWCGFASAFMEQGHGHGIWWEQSGRHFSQDIGRVLATEYEESAAILGTKRLHGVQANNARSGSRGVHGNGNGSASRGLFNNR